MWPRSAVITGAGSGLGLALATALSERGATVLGVVRRAESAAALRAACGDRVVVVLGDVTEPGVEIAIGAALAAWSAPLDLLINNAGAMASGRTLAELDADVEVDAAAAALLAWLDALPRAETGGYWDANGLRLPW